MLCSRIVQVPHHHEILVNLPLSSTWTHAAVPTALCLHMCFYLCRTLSRDTDHGSIRPESCDRGLRGCPRNPRGGGRDPYPAGV